MQEEGASLEELQMTIDNANGDFKVLTLKQLTRYDRLTKRKAIKKANIKQKGFQFKT